MVDRDGVVLFPSDPERVHEVRSPYNYDTKAASDRAALVFPVDEVSRTQQHFRDECDINTIVERFGIGYEMPEGVVTPIWGEVEALDYHGAMNRIAEAHEAFDALPAVVRARFQNDPGEFIKFASDKENEVRNREDLVKWGLIVPEAPKPAPEPLLVRMEGGGSTPPPLRRLLRALSPLKRFARPYHFIT